MNEEEKKAMKNDILFQIDMQLYDEFNDTIATMNDHLGDIYSLRDIEEVEKAEKDREIKLLREAIKKQQHKIEKLINANDNLKKTKRIKNMEYVNQNYVSKDKIKEKIKEYEGLKEIDKTAYEEQIKPLKELIDELVDYAIKAKKNDDKSVMYEGNRGKEIINQNILFEKVDETNG